MPSTWSIIKSLKKNPLSKEAQYLSAGDIVDSYAGAMEVISKSRGLKTPSGKIDIVFKYLEGKFEGEKTLKTWGKTTPIIVKGNMNDPIENPNAVVEPDNVQPETPPANEL